MTKKNFYVRKQFFILKFRFELVEHHVKAMYKIFDFAEKKKLSIDHMHSQKISNFYSGLQSFGGSFISFSELKNRSDFILFLGMTEKESSAELLIKRLSWNKKKKN